MQNRKICYRIYPTKDQESSLIRMGNLIRDLYNYAIAYRRAYFQYIGRYTKTDVSSVFPTLATEDLELVQLSKVDNCDRFLRRIRNTYVEFQLIPGICITSICRQIDAQYKGTFTKLQKGDKDARFPGFRKRHVQFIPIDFRPTNQNSPTAYIEKEGRFSIFRLKNIGELKVRSHRPLPENSKICTVDIIKKDHWYIYFTVQFEDIPLSEDIKTKPMVGVDVGIRTTLSLSDGVEFNQPHWNRITENKLAEHQRKLSRQQKFSNRWKKTKAHIRKLHEENTRRRNYWWHVVSKQLSENYSILFHEDLTLAFMNSGDIKSVRKDSYDAGFGLLPGFLSYKMPGRSHKVNPYNTSKMCCQCGNIHTELGANKIYECSKCGIIIDRDLNASINILKFGLYEQCETDEERLVYMDNQYLQCVKRNKRDYKKKVKESLLTKETNDEHCTG